MRMATGAARTPTSQPPAAGPARPASCSVDCSFPFASAIWSRADQRRDEALVRDVEEHGRDAHDERDDVHVPDLEGPEQGEDGQCRQGDGADRIRPHHDVTLAHAVDPGAGGEPDDQEGGELGRSEDADLPLAGVEDEHRQHRQRELGDLRAELAERLTAPHRQEVPVTPQRPLRGGGDGRVPLRRRSHDPPRPRPRRGRGSAASSPRLVPRRRRCRRRRTRRRRRLIGTCQSVCATD